MRARFKSILLIFILITSPFFGVKSINLEVSENLFENDFISRENLRTTKNNRSGIWYFQDLSEVNPDSIVYKFHILEGGLVHIDQSDNFIEGNGIDLTTSYFKIEIIDQLTQFNPQFTLVNENTELLELTKTWEWGYTGSNSIIAVIDSGIDFSHPSLIGKKINEKSFVKRELGYQSDETVDDFFGHGTSVAGLIVGNDPNHQEYRGVAYDGKLVSAKVANSVGDITSSGLLAAIDWAASLEEVSIINLSLGELEESPTTDLLEKIANAAVQKGKIVVSASGNNGKNGKNTFEPFTIGSPGSSVEAISVGAIDFNQNLAYQSSEGPSMGWEVKPDFIAPGVNLIVPRLNDNYDSCTISSCYRIMSGTSFSTPIMSGVFAIAYSALVSNNLPNNPGIIKGTAHLASTSIGLPWYQEGSGLVNVTKMISILINESFSGIILPKGNHHPKLTLLPAGETSNIPITIIGNSFSSWTSFSHTGNASTFTSIELKENTSGYSQIITLNVNPSNNTIPGFYVYEYNITNSNGLIVSSSLTITITDPVEYRLLLDLTHTPWDSIFASSSRHRLERLMGHDTEELIDLLIENGVWVDELITGKLTTTILERYDVVWMPSAFVGPIPSLGDREPLRSQKITNEELIVLYHFKQNGGKFIIDFGGLTADFFTESITTPDLSSLESLMSLFGLRVSNVIDNNEFHNGFVDSDLNFATTNYRTTIGVIQLTNGIPIVTNGEFNHIAGYIGENQDMAFIVNNRNWRDKSRLTDYQINGPRDFAKAVVDWILKGDRISSFSFNKIDDKIELSVLFNETVVANKLKMTINSSLGIQELTDLSIDGNQIIASFEGVVEGRYYINITYDSETTIIQKELDLQNPGIEVNMKEGLTGPNGDVRIIWDVYLLDNEDIPEYNSLVTIFDSENEVEVVETVSGYSITASNSYVEFNDVIVVVEIIDALGQYNSFELNLTSLLLNFNSTINSSDSFIQKNLSMILGFLTLILILVVSKVRISNRKKENI